MKPRNKFDHVCLELSYKLDGKPISNTHIKWAANAIYWAYYTTHYSNKICLECNHVFKAEANNDKDETVKCPSCAKKLHRTDQMHKYGYFAVYDTIEGCQVNRIFAINKYMGKNKPSKIFTSEIVRKFISPKGELSVLTKDRSGAFGALNFNYHTDFEVRNPTTNASTISCTRAATYPKKKFIPELIRNGFDWNMVDTKDTIEWTRMLLSDNFFEWLVKTNKQYANYYFYTTRGRSEMPKLKTQLKTLFHSGADLPNPSDYFDYIDLLKYFGRDIKSPKYFFPSDFHAAHQRLVKKKAAIQARENAQQRAILHDILTKEYQEKKQKYLNISIQVDDFVLTVPKTIDEFYTAGNELKHCIYTNEYYKKETVLLFAHKNGQLVETAEIDPKENSILQCRGFGNEPTEHNTTIVNIIQQNLNLFTKKQRATA
jgi:ribosomal protein S8